MRLVTCLNGYQRYTWTWKHGNSEVSYSGVQPRATASLQEDKDRVHHLQVGLLSPCLKTIMNNNASNRIRRIRCDEQKPACNRCYSTGRKCDGYVRTLKDEKSNCKSGLSGNIGSKTLPTQLRLALPRKNPQELRSFRHYLDVTAIAIAGVFEIDFWLTFVPRACHFDTAIWHAVVSLGAVHEVSISNRGNTAKNGTEFALQQFNTAINQLIRPLASGDIVVEKWRALTASVIFTYLCSFQGLHTESSMHLAAAKKLIAELQSTGRNYPLCNRTGNPFQTSKSIATQQLGAVPVPYDDLFSAVACLEITVQLLQVWGSTNEFELLGEADACITWRTYSAPSTLSSNVCVHGRCVPSRATPCNLNHAGRAIISLLNDLLALSQRDAEDITRLVFQADHSILDAPTRRQQPYIRAFCELSTAMDVFVVDTFSSCTCFGVALPAVTAYQKKAVDVLRMYCAIQLSSARNVVYQRRCRSL